MKKRKKQKKIIPKTIVTLHRIQIHHKILFGILGVIGVVMVWRGIWHLVDATPVLSSPYISVGIGFVLVLMSGAFFKML